MDAMKSEQLLSTARGLIGDAATLNLHHAARQDAIRITGIFADESGAIARRILVGLFGEPDPETGRWNDPRIGFEYNAPLALVWLP